MPASASGCGEAMAERIRIAVLHFAHETVTFLKNDTTLSDFIYPGSPAKGEALLKAYPKSYMGGFVKMAREFEGVELVGIESPLWPKTYMGSGWVTEEAFETLVGKMIEGLKAEGPFDGVYLSLHGAMAVRGVARPEAELARRVREVVGPKAFIAATFDLHGNEDDEFLKHADMGFAVKYFPHYDEYLQGERAARMLVRMIRGDYKPAHVDAESADPHRDGADVDRRLALDGPDPARADLGSARGRCLCQRVLRLSLCRRARCRHHHPGDDAMATSNSRRESRKTSPISPGASARRCWARPGSIRSPKALRWRKRRSRKAKRRSCSPITATVRVRRRSC